MKKSNQKTTTENKVGTPTKNFNQTNSIVWNLKRRYR